MTDILTLDPNDSGEIRRLVGEERTVIIRTDPGEETQNLGQYFRPDVPFDAIPRRVFEIDDTVVYRLPPTIGIVADLAGPQSPPPPLPPIPPPTEYNMADAQPLWPLERVAGAAETQVQTLWYSMTATVDGELRPDGYVGRHRDPQDRIAVQGEAAWGRLVEAAKPGGEPRRLRVQVGVGAFIAFAAVVTVTVLAVFW